jgi:hypothetical protein
MCCKIHLSSSGILMVSEFCQRIQHFGRKAFQQIWQPWYRCVTPRDTACIRSKTWKRKTTPRLVWEGAWSLIRLLCYVCIKAINACAAWARIIRLYIQYCPVMPPRFLTHSQLVPRVHYAIPSFIYAVCCFVSTVFKICARPLRISNKLQGKACDKTMSSMLTSLNVHCANPPVWRG